MPVEPVGLVFSVVSLIGLFTTCLELLDTVSSLQSHGERYQYLVCEFEIEKLLLLKWGEAAGLLSNPNPPTTQQHHSEHLEDERIRVAVAQTLGCLKRMFENANDLTKKYGLRRLPIDETLQARTDPNGHPSFATVYAMQEQMLKRVQKEASLVAKARWAVHDRIKFSELMDKISKFNKNLHRLVPMAGLFEVEHLVQVEIVKDSDITRRIVFTTMPSHRLVSDVPNAQSPNFNGRGAESSIGDVQVRDWLEKITSEYTADQHSCRKILSVESSTGTTYSTGFSSCREAQSISVRRIGSNLSRHSPGRNPIEQHIRSRMDKLEFIFLAYMIASFIITIMNIILLNSVR